MPNTASPSRKSTNVLRKSPRQLLKSLRVEVFKTQRAAAEEFAITETYLRMLESGSADPSTELLFKIAHRFGVDVYDCWPDIAGSRPQ
jgi:DNA-binding XRE family transcriptional regulator